MSSAKLHIDSNRCIDTGNLPDDWALMEAKALSNLKRWGGMFDEAVNVAQHCNLVAAYVWNNYKEHPDRVKLTYAALHHELEEAYGVGDICYDVKYHIIKQHPAAYASYNNYKESLFDQIGITEEQLDFIKEADVVVGIEEASHLGLDVSKQYPREGYQSKWREYTATVNKQLFRTESPLISRARFISLHNVLLDKLVKEGEM